MTVRDELIHVFKLFNQIAAAHLAGKLTDAEYRSLMRALEARRSMLANETR